MRINNPFLTVYTQLCTSCLCFWTLHCLCRQYWTPKVHRNKPGCCCRYSRCGMSQIKGIHDTRILNTKGFTIYPWHCVHLLFIPMDHGFYIPERRVQDVNKYFNWFFLANKINVNCSTVDPHLSKLLLCKHPDYPNSLLQLLCNKNYIIPFGC